MTPSPLLLRCGVAPRSGSAALAALHARAVAASAAPPSGRPWSEAALAALIADPAALWVEAAPAPSRERDRASAPLGFAAARRVLDEAELLILCRDPNVARRGLGARLLQALLEDAGRNGARFLFLEVGARNAPALALYANFAFQQVGLRKRYYLGQDGAAEDAIVLRKQL